MDIRKIESVCAVATYRSYTEAAYRTNLTPSVISKHVAAVEEELGLSLFRRATRSAPVELTAEGEQVIGHLQEILHQYHMAQDAADAVRREHKTLLRVGYVQQLGSFRENSILAGFNSEHPDVIIQRKAFSVQELPAQLISDGVDAVFLPLLDGTNVPGSSYARLWDGNYVITEIMRIDRLSIGFPERHPFRDKLYLTELDCHHLWEDTFLFPVTEMGDDLLAPVVDEKLGLCGSMKVRYVDFSEKIMPCGVAEADGCLLPQLCLVPDMLHGCRFIPVDGSCTATTLYLIFKKSGDRGALRRLNRYVLDASAQFYEEFDFVTTPTR